MMEVFPAIDIQDGVCVRLQQGRFDSASTYSSDPLEIAVRWKDAGATWLHVVDLDGARRGMPTPALSSVLDRLVAVGGLRIQWGGGIRTADHITRILNAGATRVVLGTAVTQERTRAAKLLGEFGEAAAVAVDARDGLVAINGWQTDTDHSVAEFTCEMKSLGAVRFIATDIATDGMLSGVNTVALAGVAEAASPMPVIASGGVAGPDDIRRLMQLQQESHNLEGVIVGKALYTGSLQLGEALALAQGGQDG
ncbi:MAG: 1-(5-phosphoribosyl)-5-((5-phosphoribosylamino)methylideneamino)imidazole-4-carboxamide isomerase [Armatimonadetes bacterium]|nr:1-(5-phosphoribosyl)-5-((5-phosphoribosylamino)methylideneamino)imidazole-4-carboxamide isomerase [Armatimonadota bacterium]MDE2208006.1 1-(5-phosphoribosyl)-5-((5-phosphoribosylamino)methylideneamino)imidazole-4-carboxamide isomerase [Armatimonadota bacterium]